MANQLKNEKSPYLKQHENNPVNWFPWNKETLEKAKKEKKKPQDNEKDDNNDDLL